MSRVIVFGLDAASPELIERWSGDLPNLRRIMTEGTWGILKSTIPPFTSPAWDCMATGVNPGRVGIFGLRQRQEGTYRFVSPTAGDRRAPAVWDIASAEGLEVLVLNVPDTYPPTPVNGVMVSGRPAPVDAGAPISFPEELRSQLDALTGGYLVGPHAAFDEASRPQELATWVQVMDRQQAALEYLMDNRAWNLVFYVSMAIDGLSHHFWRHLDPNHPQYYPQAARRYSDVIRQAYLLEDHRLGRILARMTPDDLLLVVSDHGSVPCYRHISVNRWLIEKGYLVLHRDLSDHKSNRLRRASEIAFALYRRSRWIRRIMRPLRGSAFRDAMVAAHFAGRTGGRIPFDALPIDWRQTTAYYLGDDRLYLNLAGREPQGRVRPGEEYLGLRDKIRRELMAERDPISGRALFEAIHFREAIYSGPYLELGPDLVLEVADPHSSPGGAVGPQILDEPVVSGKHHPHGVILAWGAGVRPGHKVQAQIYDVAPTVLHVLGLPVPENADGRVRRDWFRSGSPAALRSIERTSYQEVNFSGHEWTEEEQSQVEARLRDLGYLD